MKKSKLSEFYSNAIKDTKSVYLIIPGFEGILVLGQRPAKLPIITNNPPVISAPKIA